MIRRAARALRRTRNERGMTVVELMVTVAVLGVILPAIYTTVDVFGSQTTTTSDRLTAEGDVQIAMDRLTKELRATTAVAEGTATTAVTFTAASVQGMTFYSGLGGNGPTKITVSLSPVGTTGVDTLRETTTPADAGNTAPHETYTGASTIVTDASFVVPATASTSFTYYDSTGAALGPSPLTLAQMALVESVTVTLTSRVHTTSPSVTLQSTLHLENMDLATAAN